MKYKNINLGWRGDSVGKVASTQAGGPEFGSSWSMQIARYHDTCL